MLVLGKQLSRLEFLYPPTWATLDTLPLAKRVRTSGNILQSGGAYLCHSCKHRKPGNFQGCSYCMGTLGWHIVSMFIYQVHAHSTTLCYFVSSAHPHACSYCYAPVVVPVLGTSELQLRVVSSGSSFIASCMLMCSCYTQVLNKIPSYTQSVRYLGATRLIDACDGSGKLALASTQAMHTFLHNVAKYQEEIDSAIKPNCKSKVTMQSPVLLWWCSRVVGRHSS